jgi:hypothetical protein
VGLRCECDLLLGCVAITKREQTKRPFFSRSAVKEYALVGQRRRLLADRADFVAGTIFLFENRDPEGDLLDGDISKLSALEQSSRFANKFSRRLRGLFHDLKVEELVTDEELPLFYWPQTAEARIRLAWRLREIALIVRHED